MYTMVKNSDKKEETGFLLTLHNLVMDLNSSKLFAGLIIIVLNISSKFVNMRLSRTIESYLKHTFSRNILVFAICWMGTRDIYVALLLTMAFVIVFDYLLNENSLFCCMPDDFKEQYVSLIDDKEDITEADWNNLTEILEKIKKKKDLDNVIKQQQMNYS